MLTQAIRERIGGLLRSGKLEHRHANGGANGHVSTLEPARRHFVATGIEEILPGGVVDTAHGPVFAHERLYTDLGERPIPLLRRLAELELPPDAPAIDAARPSDDTSASDPLTLLPEDEFALTYWRRRRRSRDLSDITGIYDPPERGLFRRFSHRRVLYMDIETCGLTAAPVFLVGLCLIGERN